MYSEQWNGASSEESHALQMLQIGFPQGMPWHEALQNVVCRKHSKNGTCGDGRHLITLIESKAAWTCEAAAR